MYSLVLPPTIVKTTITYGATALTKGRELCIPCADSALCGDEIELRNTDTGGLLQPLSSWLWRPSRNGEIVAPGNARVFPVSSAQIGLRKQPSWRRSSWYLQPSLHNGRKRLEPFSPSWKPPSPAR